MDSRNKHDERVRATSGNEEGHEDDLKDRSEGWSMFEIRQIAGFCI